MNPDGEIVKQVIITVTQRRRVAVDPNDPDAESMVFRGGSTLILDLETLNVRYAITKRIDDEERLSRIRAYRKFKREEDFSLRATYFGAPSFDEMGESTEPQEEPFAILHSGE